MLCSGSNLVRGFVCSVLLLPLSVTAQVRQASEYLQRMDTDADGRVSAEEYLEWMLYAFDRMDRNHNGILEAEEQPPGGRGQPITRQQHQRVILERFSRQDVDQDGFLSEQELMAPPR